MGVGYRARARARARVRARVRCGRMYRVAIMRESGSAW